MPYKADEPSVSWISDSTDLKAAVRDFESVVGIDSEFKRTNTFYPIPALYQVASGKDVFLLDPLSIKDWSALVEFLEDEKKLKVFHNLLNTPIFIISTNSKQLVHLLSKFIS